MISIIVAIGKNNEIGKKNGLLWRSPADMKHFRKITMLHPVIMGRKTFESIGKPLLNRKNIVITRDANYKKEGVEIVHSLSGALDLFPDKNEEIFVIGGEEIYKQVLPITDKLYITYVNGEFPEADAFFPEIEKNKWQEVKKEKYPKDDLNKYDLEFVEYIKK